MREVNKDVILVHRNCSSSGNSNIFNIKKKIEVRVGWSTKYIMCFKGLLGKVRLCPSEPESYKKIA